MSFIIAGLGNPGDEYAGTRHNAGRIILAHLQKQFGFPEFKEKAALKALVSDGKIASQKALLLEPDNFMNRSGASLAPIIKSPKAAEKLIVIYDDLDLPFGKVKLSFNRSSGGHRGVESIIKAVKTTAFIRIRIGISPVTPSGKIKKPAGEAAVEKHILGKFKDAELAELKKLSKNIADLIASIVENGYERTVSAMGSL